MRSEEIRSIDSESGVIATLIHKPQFVFYSESLNPEHFTEKSNSCVYYAIRILAQKGILAIDAFNITEIINADESYKKYASEITIGKLNELIEMSDIIARRTVEEYMALVKNVLDAALRREMHSRLIECVKLCEAGKTENIEQQIYGMVDEVMSKYSSANEVPPYSEVIDECWAEIKSRQGNGYAGIPFKFPTLNEFVTIEKGELIVFGAEAKQGKSMLLLNCAVDLLEKGYKVLYIDSELNTRLFTARVLAHLSGVEYKKLTSGTYNEEEADLIEEKREWMKTKPFTHVYMPMFDQQSVYTTIKTVSHTQGIDVLIVDYFKGSAEGDAWDSYAELGRFVDMVKNKICGEMGICGIGAAQSTSNGKLADSAKIGRNASTIAMITTKTPDEIEADGEECGNKKLRVIMNRNGMQHAPGEYIDLQFDGNHIMYTEAKQHIPQKPY